MRMRIGVGAAFAAAIAAAVLLPPPVGGQDQKSGVLKRKWEYKIQERVYLAQPSGWHSTLPWFVSSPAIGNLNGGADLEIVSGTEEGYYEWFPQGADSGRYIAIDGRGKHLWNYATNNNAGRAAPGMADVDDDGALEVVGGSTSGWMVHLFDASGTRRWRFPVRNNANVLAPPAVADLARNPGLETVAVALDGAIYCIASDGTPLWDAHPDGGGAASGAAIADIEGDGRLEVVAVMPGHMSTWCWDGATGKLRWKSDSPGAGGHVMAAPALVPSLNGCWQRGAESRPARASGRIFSPTPGAMRCLSAIDGKTLWTYDGPVLASSPAVGDVDGDAMPEVVFGAGKSVVCLSALTGEKKWERTTNGTIYSSPALADRGSERPSRLEWPMFRHDAARTGFYGFRSGPLAVYVGSDDGYLHLIDGLDGREIDSFAVRFPHLTIQSGNYGALRFMSSPSVADVDGNGTLEAVFTLVDRVWCVEDVGSRQPEPPRKIPATAAVEQPDTNLAPMKNRFAFAQIVHSGSWNPSAPVHRKLLEELTRRAGLATMESMVPVSLRDDDVTRFPFLYITGHDAFEIPENEIRRLRGHLERGGFLLAEVCCNRLAFEDSFRALVRKLAGADLERLGPDHPIFKRVYETKTVSIRGQAVEPEFYGASVKGRLAIVFTPQDYDCSWGNAFCPSGCGTVASEDSYRMITNVVVYALTE